MTGKNVKKITCMILAVVLTLIGALPVSASAASVSAGEIAPSESVMYTATGKNTIPQLADRLEAYGVSLDSDTLLQVVKPNTRSAYNALMVTNVEGGTVSQSIFTVLDESYNAISIPVPESPENAQIMGTDDGFGMEIDDVFADGSFVFRWAILYDWERRDSGKCFARPKHAQFVCLYNASDDYSVTNAVMEFSAGGGVYDTNFTYLGSDTSHSVMVSQSTVARNTYYSRTNAYSSNRWICVTDIGYLLVEISFEVDGRLVFERYDICNLLLNSGLG